MSIQSDLSNSPSHYEGYSNQEDDTTMQSEIIQKYLFNIFDDDMIKCFCDKMKQLDNIWLKEQISEKFRDTKVKELREDFKKILDIFVDNEKKQYEIYLQEVDNLQTKIEKLLEEMSHYLPEIQLAKLLETFDSSVCDKSKQIQQLKDMFSTLSDFQDKYREKVSELQTKLKTLIKSLGLDETVYDHFFATHFLKANELEKLQNELQEKSSLFQQRESHCKEMINVVKLVAKIIPLELDEDFKCKFLNQNIVYNQANVNDLIKYHKNIMTNFKILWDSIKFKFEQVQNIYLLFGVEHSNVECFNFIKSTLENSKNRDVLEVLCSNWSFSQESTLKMIYDKLNDEYNHYERLKSEQMETIINNIRKHYIDLLEKCLVNKDSLSECDPKFAFLFNKEFDNASLELHENELEMLKRYHQKYEDFFNIIAKWFKIKEDMVECEEQLQDIYKLKNRGGIIQQILKRKRLNKKKQTQIQQQIEHWCQQNGSLFINDDPLPFNFYGLNIDQILSRLYE